MSIDRNEGARNAKARCLAGATYDYCAMSRHNHQANIATINDEFIMKKTASWAFMTAQRMTPRCSPARCLDIVGKRRNVSPGGTPCHSVNMIGDDESPTGEALSRRRFSMPLGRREGHAFCRREVPGYRCVTPKDEKSTPASYRLIASSAGECSTITSDRLMITAEVAFIIAINESSGLVEDHGVRVRRDWRGLSANTPPLSAAWAQSAIRLFSIKSSNYSPISQQCRRTSVSVVGIGRRGRRCSGEINKPQSQYINAVMSSRIKNDSCTPRDTSCHPAARRVDQPRGARRRAKVTTHDAARGVGSGSFPLFHFNGDTVAFRQLHLQVTQR